MLYLDHAATTPMRPEARAAMEPHLGEVFGNPSGTHDVSRRARIALEDARERVAALLEAEHPLDIVFTGGGTEADNLAVAGAALAGGRRGGVVTTAIEHEAVLETARFLERLGCALRVVGVDDDGVVAVDAVLSAVGDGTSVVSVMAANNETGVVEPVAGLRDGLGEPRPLIHTDAVQYAISRPVGLEALDVDMLSLSAHKFGGPKGVGLLAVRPGIDLEPVLHGGGQEVGRRSGTHNVAGIVGMVAALEASIRDRDRFVEEVGGARDEFEDSLAALIPDVVFTIGNVDRLVQHSHFRVPGIDSETLLVRLDAAGVAAAAGSACHSGAVEVSHVLKAMGLDDGAAAESVRFTFGWTTLPGDGKFAAEAVAEIVGSLR